jgi:Tol biopolymer transport system component
MGIGGDNLRTLTAPASFEYAPIFTPDGTGLIVARRDANGADEGYWRLPLISGVDAKQIAVAGAPSLGSVTLGGSGLLPTVGESGWAPRAAFSADGSALLIVDGADNTLDLLDMTGTRPAVEMNLIGNSRPVWDQPDNAFYVVASADKGSTWWYWRVTTAGVFSRLAPAAGDPAMSASGQIAYIFRASDGELHLAFATAATGGSVSLYTDDPAWNESSPSFSPDGSTIVFGRAESADPTASGGIWIIDSDGTGMTRLSDDGAYPRWLP